VETPPLELGETAAPLPDWLNEEKPEEGPRIEVVPSEPEPTQVPPLPAWLEGQPEEPIEMPIPPEPVVEVSLIEDVTISTDSSQVILQAQSFLQSGQIEKALQLYEHLISRDQKLEETIHDLRDALYRYPVDSAIWQILGDAYMRNNHIQDALDAYTKAEELLR
jgi:tetratricopeptide (TPR) repeat protein